MSTPETLKPRISADFDTLLEIRDLTKHYPARKKMFSRRPAARCCVWSNRRRARFCSKARTYGR